MQWIFYALWHALIIFFTVLYTLNRPGSVQSDGKDIGFWSDIRRVTVALTRSKHVLRICGQGSKWSGCLKELYDDAYSRGCVCDV